MSETPVLSVAGLSAGYNGLAVVRDINLTVAPGEVVALLGSNGAGKTTTLSAIAGLIKPMGGTIELDGVSTAKRSAHQLARAGVALVPEDRALFHDLTTRENLKVAAVRAGRRGGRARGAASSNGSTGSAASNSAASNEEQVLELLPELKKCLGRKAGLLSGGEQQMLAVGRALVGNPRLLIVDEMSLGLAPVVVERLLPVLKRIANLGTAVLVVEQHVTLAMDVASRAYVLAHGHVVLEGTTEKLKHDQALITASYFGDPDAEAQLSASTPDAASPARRAAPHDTRD